MFFDRGSVVESLDDLVSGGYLKKIPIDPVTHFDFTWVPTAN